MSFTSDAIKPRDRKPRLDPEMSEYSLTNDETAFTVERDNPFENAKCIELRNGREPEHQIDGLTSSEGE
jgi:hypothetical protein